MFVRVRGFRSRGGERWGRQGKGCLRRTRGRRCGGEPIVEPKEVRLPLLGGGYLWWRASGSGIGDPSSSALHRGRLRGWTGGVCSARRGCRAKGPMRCRRSLLAKGSRRRAGVARVASGSGGGAGDGALGRVGSRAGAGGAVVRLTMIVTGGGDLRRVSLWPRSSADLERSGSLEMEGECPPACFQR
jgi:hypothetical protein